MDNEIMITYIHYLLVNTDYHNLLRGKKLADLVKNNYKDYLHIILVVYNEEIGFYES